MIAAQVETPRMPTLVEVPCPRCASMRSRPVVQGRDHLYGIPGVFTAAACSDCGLLFQNPRPPVSEMHTLYPVEYTPHHAATTAPAVLSPRELVWRVHLANELAYPPVSAPVRARMTARRLRRAFRREAGERLVPRFRAGGMLLEIGCGSGDRLATLRDLGWTHLTGIDVVPGAVETARARGFDVRCGDAADQLARVPDASLDVVIASMVLEHLPSPFAVVDLITKKLKPGGELLFSTVLSDSWDAAHYGAYWAGYDFPRHMVFFTRTDLCRMLAEGFERLEEFPQNAPVDFVRAARWRAPEGRLEDRLMTAAPERALRTWATCLVWLRRSTRASFRCVRTPRPQGS